VFSFKIGLMQAQLKAFGRECAWGTRLGAPLVTWCMQGDCDFATWH